MDVYGEYIERVAAGEDRTDAILAARRAAEASAAARQSRWEAEEAVREKSIADGQVNAALGYPEA